MSLCRLRKETEADRRRTVLKLFVGMIGATIKRWQVCRHQFDDHQSSSSSKLGIAETDIPDLLRVWSVSLVCTQHVLDMPTLR